MRRHCKLEYVRRTTFRIDDSSCNSRAPPIIGAMQHPRAAEVRCGSIATFLTAGRRGSYASNNGQVLCLAHRAKRPVLAGRAQPLCPVRLKRRFARQ